MTTKIIHVVVFAFALLGLTIGCRTTPAPPAAIDHMSYTGKQVKVNSHIFDKLFKVVNVKQAKGSNQLLMVSIALENLQEVSMSIEFQSRWAGENSISERHLAFQICGGLHSGCATAPPQLAI